MRILAVEDEPAIARMYRWLFEDEEIVVVPSVSAALDALEGDAPDLVILDFGLGHSDASELAPSLMRLRIPVVVISADRRAEAFALEIGAPLLWKPFDTDRLFETVNQLLATRRPMEGSNHGR